MKLKCIILLLTITIIVVMNFADINASKSKCPKTHTKIRLASKIKFAIFFYHKSDLINTKIIFDIFDKIFIVLYVVFRAHLSLLGREI